MGKVISMGKATPVGDGGSSPARSKSPPVINMLGEKNARDFASEDMFFIDLEDSCNIFEHFESVSQGLLGGESTGTGTGSMIGGKGVLDKMNTEGKERNRRQSFDGIDVVDERSLLKMVPKILQFIHITKLQFDSVPFDTK